MITQAFWIEEGEDTFRATIHTQGPWHPDFQHGGPPAALLVRQIEHCSPRPDMMLARVSIDILGPMPIATFRATARMVRPGRSVELLEATLEHEGRTVMRANAWRVKLPNAQPPAQAPDQAPPIPAETTDPTQTPAWNCGFLAATEWRFVHGNYAQIGSAMAWIRLRFPLLAGEELSPTQRLIATADSANGISSALDISTWQFIPPELTLHILRPPTGEWLCLDAATIIQSEGIGLTTSKLYDTHGLAARSAQSLFISRRTQ
ncbi:hypothetical protein KSD_84890 [Ktedonobacter sp. SOSP1-85]|uniref:thioesterase family protein n=1 Tax=Ktedonobacter sp. SOSP1-85 TaxID=2778367 RepID=UPI0019161986|nr:thioesterase family protein [Ktedonobacter sp. SOSP1-85]GHO80718.1 hypothetical protein KSD_84890 [Ktedonobacter sp. SOSP1-85]